MKHFLAPDIWPMILAAVVWWLLSLAPILYSALLAFRAKPVMPRRVLFVGTVSTLSYGLLILFVFVVSLPLGAFSTYIAPTLREAGDLTLAGRWAGEISDAISSWGFFIIPLILAGSALWLSRRLLPRWPQIVIALGPNNSSKPTPLRGVGKAS